MNINSLMDSVGCNVIMITDKYNLRYITGFRGGEGTALILRDKGYLLVDSRYTEAAGREVKEKKDAAVSFEVIEFNNAQPKYKLAAEIILSLNEAVTIGFEDRSMLCYELEAGKEGIAAALREYFPEKKEAAGEGFISWKPLGDLIERERRIKTPEELKLLRKAEAIGDKAFSDILNILKPGMTELEVAAELEYSMKKNGAAGLSFDTIAASGINSSMPHAIPGTKKLENGDFLTMDFGCMYEGYCSDMTRTVVIGKASDEQKKIYNIVLKAQTEAVSGIRAGLKCIDVDRIARSIIEEAGYGRYFGHGLGHSVGLYIHESPALNTRDETVLVEGMIETIEPGIYIPGFGGVRIEDMGAVTKDGYDNFASSPKELIEI